MEMTWVAAQPELTISEARKRTKQRGSVSVVRFLNAAMFQVARTEWAGAVKEGFLVEGGLEAGPEKWICIWRERDRWGRGSAGGQRGSSASGSGQSLDVRHARLGPSWRGVCRAQGADPLGTWRRQQGDRSAES